MRVWGLRPQRVRAAPGLVCLPGLLWGGGSAVMGYALLSHPTRLGVGGGLVGFEDAFGAGGVFGEFVWGADGAGG